jgi:hypothetical protein
VGRLKIAVFVMCALLFGCTFREEERDITPWLRVKVSYSKFGELSGITKTVQFSARTWGFWHKIDAASVAILATGDTVLLFRGREGTFFLDRGSFTARPACEPGWSPFLIPSYPKPIAAVDCVRASGASSGSGMARMMEWKRVATNGNILASESMRLEDPERVLFDREHFFDPDRNLLFISVREAAWRSSTEPPACELVGWHDHKMTLVATLPALDKMDCTKRLVWAESGVRLAPSDNDGKMWVSN